MRSLRSGAPGSRRPWFTLALAVGGAVVVAALVVALYLPRPSASPNLGSDPSQPSTPYVQVDGYDLIVAYTTAPGQPTGYFDSPDCVTCPDNLTPSASWHLSFTLRNTDPAHAHNVTSIDIGAPFTVVSVSPSFPASVAAGGSVTVDMNLQLPATSGYYFLTGSINAE